MTLPLSRFTGEPVEGYEPVNLDGLGDRDLEAMDALYTRLAIITDAMRRARVLRLAGDIEAALSFERHADVQYKTLPVWAAW